MVTVLRYGVDDHGTRNSMPPLTRDFTGSDAHGKVIIASRWRAFSTGLFFTAYMGIFADSGIIEDYTKGIKSMIFSSVFSEIAFFMFFKKVVEVFCLEVPISK